jgi:hypothetical protein
VIPAEFHLGEIPYFHVTFDATGGCAIFAKLARDHLSPHHSWKTLM